jgi:SAM-dependent methyltransferase
MTAGAGVDTPADFSEYWATEVRARAMTPKAPGRPSIRKPLALNGQQRLHRLEPQARGSKGLIEPMEWLENVDVAGTPSPTRDELKVAAWAEVQEPLELQLAPLGRRALAALAPRSGESVLDIGCGGGRTALELAQLVAPDGTVVGIDLSAAVLAFAHRAANGHQRVQFIQADAEVFPFEPASFDAAFSQFGVMFFADPTAAFINIRRSLRPNGRLAFVCWRALEDNCLDIIPLRSASAHLPPQPAHDPDSPGPFAFAKPDRVRGILERAGFGEIEIAAHDAQVGSGDLDTMLAVISRVGALGKILRENPGLRAATLPAVRSALAAHDGPDGVKLKAATV